MDLDEEAAATSLKAYYHLLRDNRAFTVLWIGEVGLGYTLLSVCMALRLCRRHERPSCLHTLLACRLLIT